MSSEHLVTPLEDQLDALFGQYTAAHQSRGLAYGLIGPGGLVHSAGFGSAGDRDTAPDANTVFPIASMTKSFVACAALLARDRRLLDLEAPITAYVEEFTASGTFDDPVDPPTVRMLLSMGGGLTEDNSWVDPFIDKSLDELLTTVQRGLHYSSLPGSAFEYSNIGFALAGLAVGRAVGRPIEDWIQEEIIAPLGMTRTWFDNRVPADPGARATGYHLDPDGGWIGYPPAFSDAFAAAGGLQSTVQDLATWVNYLASAFRPPSAGGHGPVCRASLREMQRVHQINLPALASVPGGSWRFGVGGYGLGLGITEDLRHGTLIGHSGGLPGFLLHMTWHPDSGHGMVVLTNSHRGDPVTLAQQALFRVLDHHGCPARTIRLWPATRDLRRDADQLIRSWNDDSAHRILAPNVAVDRPLDERRSEIERLIADVGPLTPQPGGPGAVPALVSAATPADVTWSIPGERGELICMIHLAPTSPPQIQELEVVAAPYGTPRSARPSDISARRAGLRPASLTSLLNTRIEWPG